MARQWRRTKVRLAALVPVTAAVVLCGLPTPDAAAQARWPDRDVPDLALIVAGGSGRTTVARSGETVFAGLWQLLQPTYTGTERVPDAWAEGRHPPVRMTVVWGLTGVGGWPQTNRPPGGDVAVERQDQLVVAADGTPWVRSDPAPDVDDDDIRWHRAPRSVFVRLDREGVLDSVGDGPAGSGAAGHEAGRAASSAWWAVPGLAAGFAAGVGGSLLIRRAAARHGAGPPREEPRQELIDL
ncbi:hypothetical protein [Streptomyces sp. NPDC001315]|uniref:hypothetical protein n=1 Tax=Streptomyces sp. NPDC001315 TaxID=3364562 RepID=UPI0036C8501F